ncbi:MAG: bifunctional folylpolyglutamate synthase/dihydrofolate synthase, partial [Paludibacteraceae bacterium]|nr:bifunctional folylpolyglutamate synthase/dihydrofolate synthase [Paludibacteraceae bacterium]
PVFMQKAAECEILGAGLETTDCRLFFADQCGYLRREREKTVTSCELHGAYQEKNMQTAYVALHVLSTRLWGNHCEVPELTEAAIATGFAQVCRLTGLRGRWEQLADSPLTICDTGHNSHGIRTYVADLRRLHAERTGGYNASQSINSHLRIVFGMVSDKDVNDVLTLLPTEAMYYWTQAQTSRAIPAEQMRMMGLSHGLMGISYDTVEQAIQAAQNDAATDDIIFIGGSNYLVGEALKLRY